ncbi:stage III sporulation protein AH [Thermoanaerobacter kivui]|uniref:Stage III sporulation protein AH n=1 Tax=Thermoanaerobacter kivui TaxID=2325 RepID=A0A097ARD7_THEKI|nr:SpoIIIAH-like family protein [Thermoanaerobacter kivui]AIS52375.1 stage III sporulation protein AH [Thermoanaerobacter kivui]
MVYMKKKLVAIVSLILLIAIAFVLNYGYTNKKEQVTKNQYGSNLETVTTTSSTTETKLTDKDKLFTGIFTTYREEREINRSRSIDALKEIVENKNTSQATRDQAQRQIIKLTEITNQEMIIENLIKAKGFQDAVVLIDNGIVNVIVQADKLSEQEVAQIQDIVSRQTGVSLDNIKIMTRLE